MLNQWTYHARLYRRREVRGGPAGQWNLVQLVSFGCGVDAITTRRGARHSGSRRASIYTQIKIDEITNLGAVNIRLRSLFAALGLGSEATPH